jgi:hypothetical protein
MNSSRDNARKGVLCAGGEGARAQNKLSHCGHRKKLRNQPERVVIGEKQQIEEAAASSSVSSLDFLCGVAASCRPERASVLLAAGRKNDFYNPVSCLSLSLSCWLACWFYLWHSLRGERAGKFKEKSTVTLLSCWLLSGVNQRVRPKRQRGRGHKHLPLLARIHIIKIYLYIYTSVCVVCIAIPEFTYGRVHAHGAACIPAGRSHVRIQFSAPPFSVFHSNF